MYKDQDGVELRARRLRLRSMRGAAPFSAERAAVNTRPGAYDREVVRHLDDYADRDTELFAAAVQIYEERLAAARQGKTCI